MAEQQTKPRDEPSSAPESGTGRDETSGNRPAADRPRQQSAERKDDPSVAPEER